MTNTTYTQVRMYGNSYQSHNYKYADSLRDKGLAPFRFVKLNNKGEMELGNSGNLLGVTTPEYLACNQSVIMRGMAVAVELDSSASEDIKIGTPVKITTDGKISDKTGVTTDLVFVDTNEEYVLFDNVGRTTTKIKVARVDIASSYVTLGGGSARNESPADSGVLQKMVDTTVSKAVAEAIATENTKSKAGN